MKAIDVIRMALEMTLEGTVGLVEDMRDVPLTRPMPRGGNHPLWLLGHLCYIEGNQPRILFGEEGGKNPVEHWAPLFASGTEPKSDAAAYPSFDEVLGTYRRLRAKTLKMLEEVGDAGLDRQPRAVPPGFENSMRTFGQTFLLLALHNMVHYGQIADARRAAGRKPLL
jgi:hypothetical protein